MIKVIPTKAENLNMFVSELKECYALFNSERINSNSVKQALRMIKRRRRPGMKLAALGIGLIIFPEPTELSDVLGVLLLALSKPIEKAYDFIGIDDLGQEVSDTLKSLASLRSEIISH
ncbi:MAG: hypothetical protein H3Z52_10910 [archaeon]|nr:hypothetical protein [archaeon]MCP8321430.1 hypothetical protein [archaeon]